MSLEKLRPLIASAMLVLLIAHVRNEVDVQIASRMRKKVAGWG